MTPERWGQIKHVFAAALDVGPAARSATVHALCAGDDGLRDEVRSLLAAHASLSATGWLGQPVAPLPEPEFVGDARFSVEARLGAGGFGVVYRAIDRTRARAVALKVLREPDGLGLVRFKREFRALADLVHPQLVRLDELFAMDSQVFFSMELVHGRPLVEPLQSACAAGDWRSVARAFTGLVEGVRALHAAGLLHRDLKPSNVLLTDEGRVVILDFGLAASLRAPDGAPAAPLAGTPAYMAPEQFLSNASSAASDLYAVGTMLFEAVVGRLPFEVFPDQLLALVDAKTTRAARLPPGVSAGMPVALARLCELLLQVDARVRPGAAEALAILRPLAGEAASVGVPAIRATRSPPFVGRQVQLTALRAAWTRARGGELAVVCLRGASGMGKTALARRFFEEVTERGDALVLEGRCHEREAVAYKALDGVVDGLRQVLESLPADEAEGLRPDGVEELEQLFPVLRLARHAPPSPAALASHDDGARRRRAFAALRDLLTRVATRRPVALFIDDLQWGDDDSAALLRALLHPGGAPPLLLVAACRRDIEIVPSFASLLEALESSGCCREVPVEPLADDEASALATALLGDGHEEIEAVATEAGGVPFFVDTLVEEVRERAAAREAPDSGAPGAGAEKAPQDLRLRSVIGARVQRLSGPARRLLEAIALAGKPVPRPVAEAAAALDGDEGGLERLLRARRLVRLSGDGVSLEVFHDRIRDGVLAILPATARVQLHGRLARALAGDGRADPEDLAHHLAAAGERAAAAEQAVRAAERRTQTMAFERAAALYATAIELRGTEHPDNGTLATRRAEALAAAGHGAAAGEAFFAAADRLPAERASLVCRGAEQLIRAGDVARGRHFMERVLRGLGWRVPRTAMGALLAVAVRRAALAIRGLHAPARAWSPSSRSGENLLRMDASWALASSAMILDTVRATYYQTHHLRLALDEGEPFRLARALGLEAISASLPGGRSPARADRILSLLRAVTESAAHPIMNGLAPLSEGVVAASRGEWRRARDRSLIATELLASHGAGVAWELSTARSFLLGALVSMGEFREYAARFPLFLEDSRARSDLYSEAVLVLSACSYIVPLMDDRIVDAEAVVNSALAQLAGRGFQLPKLWGFFAQVDIALYAGDASRAWRLLSQPWPVARSLLLYVQTIRVYIRHLRGRAALAMAAGLRAGRAKRRFLAIAAREARALERERVPWSDAFALLLRAGIAHHLGDLDAARARLGDADRALAAVDMAMHAASARHALGRLLGGAAGEAAVHDAEAWMRGQDVRRPERVAAVVYPGPA